MLLLIVVSIYFFSFVQKYRAQIAVKQAIVENEPEASLRQAVLLRELESQQEKLVDLQESVPRSENIGNFIGYLERLSGDHKVVLKIPEIMEEVKRNEQGMPVAWSGPFKEARLKINATGEPLALLNFLGQIERSAYLVTVKEWLVRGAVKASGSALMSVPDREDGVDRESTSKTSSILDAQLILTIVNNDGY